MRNTMMIVVAAALMSVGSVARGAAEGGGGGSPTFKRIALSDQFFSEGATYGDFNKDGTLDYAAGPFWYEGPDFKTQHKYYDGAPIDPKGYSANFVAFAHDFNNDQWPDIFIVGFPGEKSFWYENPKGKDGPWPQHKAVDITDNESPTFGDLTGDGRPELVFHSRGLLGWAEPDPQNPTAEWRFRKASANPDQRFHKFTHGLGFGDVNGDGKNDFLEVQGWWEQPASLEGDPEWKFHKVEGGFGGGGAQMYAYDVDGDRDNDVITSLAGHGYGLAWFENTGKAGDEIKFERRLILSDKPEEQMQGVQFSQLHAVDLYDMNGDGLKDIITGKRFWAHGPAGDPDPNAPAVLYWFELKRDGGGKATFVPHKIDDQSGVGTQVMAGDLNGDKLGDVIVGNKKGQFIFIQEAK